jgi:hypothetical protein
MVSLRQFYANFDISIRCKQNRLPRLACVYDSCLMETVLQLPFTKQELIDVNLVRIYLQITTLSDIVSADGQVILKLSWNGHHIPDRRSTMQFARQLQPTVYQRGLWRRLLRSYLVPGSKTFVLQLQHPLRAWVTDSNMNWGAMTWEDNLYRRDPHNDCGKRCVALHYPHTFVHSDGTPESGTFYDATPDWYTATTPRFAIPTDITGDQIFLTTHSVLQHPSIPAPADTFAIWVSQLPPAERRSFLCVLRQMQLRGGSCSVSAT